MTVRKRHVDALPRTCLILALAGSVCSLNPGYARASDASDLKAVSATAVLDASALDSPKKRRSYALGMALGNQFREKSVEVDLDLYGQGLKDAFSGSTTLLSETEASAEVSVLQRELKSGKTQRHSQGASDALTAIKVSFKLDSRLTRGMYMGDRWVSPPTFTSVHPGKTASVDIRAQGADATGKSLRISPEWEPEDPEMVTVTPGRGERVKITVQREGQSKLRVHLSGVSTELLIKVTYQGDTTQVEISQ